MIIALLWMDKDEDLDNKFTKAKDIIAILVEILGTIVGFYFGSNPTGTSGTTPQAALSSPNAATASRPGAASSAGSTTSAGATGAAPPAGSPSTPQETSPTPGSIPPPKAIGPGSATPENAPAIPR